MKRDERPWEPEPIPVEEFRDTEAWANINRSPLDRVSGVVYKRAANIKRVAYEPLQPAPEMPETWQGRGRAVVRWLFSEQTGTEEGVLPGRGFSALRDIELPPGSATGQSAEQGLDTILYVVDGEGVLNHRPSTGSPIVARPLREGDAVLIEAGELYSVENPFEDDVLRLIVLTLTTPGITQVEKT
ncbi:MAG: cupin domain-containing protein [Anaerolineae bacterium]